MLVTLSFWNTRFPSCPFVLDLLSWVLITHWDQWRKTPAQSNLTKDFNELFLVELNIWSSLKCCVTLRGHFVFVFWNKVYLCNNPGYLGTLLVDQTGLELTEILLPLSSKCCSITTQQVFFFLITNPNTSRTLKLSLNVMGVWEQDNC